MSATCPKVASLRRTHTATCTSLLPNHYTHPPTHLFVSFRTAHGMAGVPGVFFNYEISPMLVIHTETRQSFAHFLTSYATIHSLSKRGL